jgi:[protein-PII] uridylyltransferase
MSSESDSAFSEAYVAAFAASLPEIYRKHFDAKAIFAHSRLSWERKGETVRVGTFHSSRVPGAALCVIAEDRPGLLALISAALMLTGLDVIEAEAYTRRVQGRFGEAVDIFWVRALDPRERALKITASDLAELQQRLTDLLAGRLDLQGVEQAAPVELGPHETVVRFLEGKDGQFSTLEVETGDRSGLLLALTRALYQQRVQIVSSSVKTNGRQVTDRFDIVEFDNSPISPARRLAIQVAVLSAVDPPAEFERPSRPEVS